MITVYDYWRTLRSSLLPAMTVITVYGVLFSLIAAFDPHRDSPGLILAALGPGLWLFCILGEKIFRRFILRRRYLKRGKTMKNTPVISSRLSKSSVLRASIAAGGAALILTVEHSDLEIYARIIFVVAAFVGWIGIVRIQNRISRELQPAPRR